MHEMWRPIPGFEKHYVVSDMGRVKNLHTGRVLKGSAAGEGYRKVILCADGVQDHRYVHTVVLETFVGTAPSGMEAAHGNGIRHDNRLSNLRWATRSDNHMDKRKHGTMSRGETHGRGKLTAKEVRLIRGLEGTCKEIGARFDICPMQVSRIKTGKNWGHIS